VLSIKRSMPPFGYIGLVGFKPRLVIEAAFAFVYQRYGNCAKL
jgi:hypothetical protein